MPLDKDAESQTQYKNINPYDTYDLDELSDTDSSDDTLTVASKFRPVSWRQPPLSRLWVFIYIVVFGLKMPAQLEQGKLLQKSYKISSLQTLYPVPC
ncbi:hypothetical protein Daus18300_002489 [Diaporthe australafricana]|uniref:Uncharacterized protein n=1 Tax=Diaporthe australafricana TaxID=127596 RepID=A0ABR3XND5_9PEZI